MVEVAHGYTYVTILLTFVVYQFLVQYLNTI